MIFIVVDSVIRFIGLGFECVHFSVLLVISFRVFIFFLFFIEILIHKFLYMYFIFKIIAFQSDLNAFIS